MCDLIGMVALVCPEIDLYTGDAASTEVSFSDSSVPSTESTTKDPGQGRGLTRNQRESREYHYDPTTGDFAVHGPDVRGDGLSSSANERFVFA